MEKIKEQVCIPCELGWSDVGSWDEIAKLQESADAVEVDGSGNFVFSRQNKVVGFVDVSNLVVVDTADALLIAALGAAALVTTTG